jgi:hypothetical protein
MGQDKCKIIKYSALPRYLQWIRSLYIAKEADGVWETTTVNADTPVSLFRGLPDLELFSSIAEASGFPEY